MSVGFSFRCRLKKPEELISSARQLAREQGYQFFLYPEQNGLTLGLCPMGGELHFRWRRRGGLFPYYELEGDCQSTPAGPGLHKAAADAFYALDQIGEQKFRFTHLYFGDEAGYFDHWNFDKSVREHFHPWLASLVEMCGQRVLEGTDPQLCLCWRAEQYVPKEVPGTLVTPVGRFSARGMKELAETQGIAAVAERFFLWYHPERRDALYCRNLALNLLWEECRYVPSGCGEEDRRINDTILDSLEEAARLDPALPLPRQSYEEVCALAGREPALPEGPLLEEEFSPGYRKELVTYTAGLLRLTLPGSYRYEREQWDETSGCDLWCDDTVHSPIWRVNGYQKREGSAAFTPALDGDSDLTEFELKGGAVRFGWRELPQEDGVRLYQVRSEVVTGPSLFVITVTHLEPEERPGIEELIKKITVQTQQVEKQTIQANKED